MKVNDKTVNGVYAISYEICYRFYMKYDGKIVKTVLDNKEKRVNI